MAGRHPSAAVCAALVRTVAMTRVYRRLGHLLSLQTLRKSDENARCLHSPPRQRRRLLTLRLPQLLTSALFPVLQRRFSELDDAPGVLKLDL